MRINRTDLINHLNAEIANRQADYAARCAAADDKAKRAEADYVTKTGDAWREFARRVVAEVDHRHAVTVKAVPSELLMSGEYVRFFKAPDSRVTPPNTAALRSLVAMLGHSPDETVSLASLERAGFVLGKVLGSTS